MRIIEARPEHAKDILHIRRVVRAETYANDAIGATRDYLLTYNRVTQSAIEKEIAELRSDDSSCWVAVEGPVVVGYLQTCGPPRQSIDKLHVLESYRGRGVGSTLLQRALESLDRSKPIYLEIVQGNNRALQWWQKIGWHLTGRVLDGTPLPRGDTMLENEMVLAPIAP